MYPKAKEIFSAFNLCPLPQVKVVILGQDPYHGEGQAHGLCFSVPDGVPIPPSLQNIFKEMQTDLKIQPPKSGNLERLAKQGVFLLNSCLTVKANQPASHKGKGWEEFTDFVIQTISEKKERVVFILWGSFAIQKKHLIRNPNHLVITSPHPSPLSCYRGFFGSRPFSQTNEYLARNGLATIEW